MAIEVGNSLGATAQSWNRASARSILERLVKDRPSIDKEGIYREFLETVLKEENSDVVRSIIEYWFYNNYRYLVERPRLVAAQPEERVAERRQAIDQAKAVIRQSAVKLVLLDIMLPHGKTLAESTGKECKTLAPKVGAWLEKIGEKIMPNATVGGSLSENQVRELYEVS